MRHTEAASNLALGQTLAGLGRDRATYEATRSGQLLLDSIQAAEREADLARLRVSFGTERKEKYIRELTQQDQHQRVAARHQR